MICYKDKTFCSAPCAVDSCPRKFTEADRQGAERWWSGLPGEPPVAFADMRVGCPDFTPRPASD